jgi:hypothetical protein
MLKPNQPQKFALLGQDYVLWQDPQGTIAALPNACPHMGAMLSEGWCVTQPQGSSTIRLSLSCAGVRSPRLHDLTRFVQADEGFAAAAGTDHSRRFNLDVWRL